MSVRCELCGRFKKRVFPGTDLELRCVKEYYDSTAPVKGWRHEYPQRFLGKRRRRATRGEEGQG